MGIGGNRPFRGAVISTVTVTAPATAGVVGTPYTGTATAVLVDPDDGTYTKVWSGSGVAGLTINATSGAITGTPTAAGTFTVTYTVTDSGGTVRTGTDDVTVTATKAVKAEKTKGE